MRMLVVLAVVSTPNICFTKLAVCMLLVQAELAMGMFVSQHNVCCVCAC